MDTLAQTLKLEGDKALCGDHRKEKEWIEYIQQSITDQGLYSESEAHINDY